MHQRVVVIATPLIKPTIQDFTNAVHNHSNTAAGGNVPSTSVTGLVASATTDTTSAANISSGTLPGARTNTGTTFSAQTSVTITGATHGRATRYVNVTCVDNATPPNSVTPDHWTVDTSTFNVVISFVQAQTGACSVN